MRRSRPTSPAGWVLELTNASRSYGPTRAVDDVSLALRAGEVLGVIRPNGAGKSTLMKVISGEVAADSGSLSIGGEHVNAAAYSTRAAKRLGVRVVNQELSLCTNLRVFENFLLEFSADSTSRWRGRARATTAAAMDDAFPTVASRRTTSYLHFRSLNNRWSRLRVRPALLIRLLISTSRRRHCRPTE